MAQPKQKRDSAAADTAMFAPMMAFGPKAVEAWQDIINESVGFMTRRLERDLETQQAMLNCKTPADLLKVQADFIETTFAQYTEEANRMMKIMAKAGNAARGYDDVPL